MVHRVTDCALCRRFGVDAELITPEEVKEMLPLLQTEDLMVSVAFLST